MIDVRNFMWLPTSSTCRNNLDVFQVLRYYAWSARVSGCEGGEPEIGKFGLEGFCLFPFYTGEGVFFCFAKKGLEM